MNSLIAIEKSSDIPECYAGTPVGLLLEYHNLGKSYGVYSKAELLVGMCMDNRKHLRMPDNFAYIIRSGGANLRYSEFKVSYAIGVGGVRAIVIIGHDGCGMVNLVSRRDLFVSGLVENAGWEREAAEEHFQNYAPLFEIGSEVDFTLSEVQRLRARYPALVVAPMFYMVESGMLYLISE